MPIPSFQLQKKIVLCREAEGLVTELWSPRFVTIQWLCCQLCYVTAVNQRTIVEIQILATVSWTCGCQPFSCRCSQHVTHCPKEICWTCLFKESIPAIPFRNSKHPTYQKHELPESRVRSAMSALNHGCIMPIPLLQEDLFQYTVYWLCFSLTVVWKWGCQPFSCRCSQNVMHCRKEMCWTCLFKESIPFLKSKPPLPTRSLSFLRAAYVLLPLH